MVTHPPPKSPGYIADGPLLRASVMLGLKPSEASASERGSAKVTVARPRSVAAKQAAGRVSGVKVPSRDEGAVLDALRAMPTAEHRAMVKLVLAYGSDGPRAVAERRRMR
jgi:hypothetical protein